MRVLAAASALALVLASAPAAAQAVRGELVERTGGSPISSAMVVLLDAAGNTRGQVLTDSAGRFLIRAPHAGEFRLRAERVGYRNTVSPPLALAEGQTLSYRMVGDALALTLEGISVSTRRRCRPRPGSGPETATVWEEARKVLSATALAEEQQLLRYDMVVYDRELEPGSLRVTADRRWNVAGQARTPFESVPVEVLSRQGFVVEEADSVLYQGPDADVLLSEAFLTDHCFRLTEDPARPGQVGLAFEPVSSRTVPEVAGTLWLDRASAELRTLEFRYVQLPRGLDWPGAGGEVHFERLPTGRWIVGRWLIRMPQWGHAYTYATSADRRAITRSHGEAKLTAIREKGGEVVAASVREARADAPTGRLAGVVWDSVSGGPLSGARVFLSGTQWAAVTDAAGRWEMRTVPEGRYTLSFAHPALAAWGVAPATTDVAVKPGEARELALGFPSLETLVARRCPAETEERHRGVVMGMIDRGGRPQPAAVRFTWRELRPEQQRVQELHVEVPTDANGFYVACGLPVEVQLTVRVDLGDGQRTGRLLLREPFLRYDVHMAQGGSGSAGSLSPGS